MQVVIENSHRFSSELRRKADLDDVPLSTDDVTQSVADLVDDTYIDGVLSDVLPIGSAEITATIEPVFKTPPLVDEIDVRLRTGGNGSAVEHHKRFKSGRWSRTRQQRLLQLRQEGTLAEGETAFHMLIGLPAAGDHPLQPPALQPPPIIDGTLEQFGFREFGEGGFVPDRPVLVNNRMAEDAVNACLAAGARETGGTALGALVRLKEPLANTTTRIVTLLTTCLEDRRHSGKLNEWSISPEAIAAGQEIADMRGMGESVMTIVHTHGFSTECGNCNQNASCPLAECTHVSLLDYQVMETLFPGKSTLMPIAGRKLGAPGKRPVLEIHAWRGGEMRPVRWKRYQD